MNPSTATKIENILTDLRRKASSSFETQIGTIKRAHNYPPMIVPPFMVREAMSAAQDNVLKLIARAETEISAISKTMEAHSILKAGVLLHLSALASLVQRWNGVPLNPSNLELVDKRATAVRQDVMARVEASEHWFKNLGGRPPEWNWDAAKDNVRMALSKKGRTKYRGINKELAEMLEQWFLDKGLPVPGRTMLQEHARLLAEELQRP